MKLTKILALGGLLAGAGFAQSALAAPVTCGLNATELLSVWAAQTDGCIQQDKIFTFLDLTNNNATDLSGLGVLFKFSPDSPGPGIDTHQIVFNQFPTSVALDYVLTYSIAIDLSQNADNIFKNASIGVDVPGSLPGTTVTKTYFSDAAMTSQLAQLALNNAGSAGPTNGVQGQTELWVSVHIQQPSTASLNSVTDTYEEALSGIPEPGTLALLGLGLLGLGSRRSRKA